MVLANNGVTKLGQSCRVKPKKVLRKNRSNFPTDPLRSLLRGGKGAMVFPISKNSYASI